jgi:antitoxin component HigA of HigAB toxin-antitoxin module
MHDKNKKSKHPSISRGNMTTTATATNFGRLQTQLIQHLRKRIHSGEITERSLARLTGISQPHLHNVLKGKRLLSLEMADRILLHLQLDLKFLMDAEQHGH